MAEKISLFGKLLELPAFQEAGLNKVPLSPEEEEQIETEVKQLLLEYLRGLPAFRKLSE